MSDRCILYCNCTYAKVVPPETKAEVLSQLSETGVAFDAVADLCEMSARKDPELQRYASTEGLRIAACYPRAVRWLFHGAGAPLQQEDLRIENMREETPGAVVEGLFQDEPQVFESGAPSAPNPAEAPTPPTGSAR